MIELLDILGNIFEKLVVSCVCIVPLAFVIGTIVAIPLMLLPERGGYTTPERHRLSKQIYSRWPETLAASFIGGLTTFPIARLINGASLTPWNYLALFSALLFFALLTPVMAGKTLEGENSDTTTRNLYIFWVGLALGALSGVLCMIFLFK